MKAAVHLAIAAHDTGSIGAPKLASMGTSAKWGNQERDLMSHMQKLHQIQLYHVPLSVVGDDLKVRTCKLPVVLPHELIHALYKYHRPLCMRRFQVEQCEQLEDFWSLSSRCTWFRDHPGRQDVLRDPLSCIPIRVHGDDVPVSEKIGKLNVINFCSSLTRGGTSYATRHPMVAFKCNKYHDLDDLFHVLAWSFQVLLDGKMPSHDPDGKVLTGRRASMQGQDVAGGLKFLLAQFLSDLAYSKDALQLECNWQADQLCPECDGTALPGPCCAYDFVSDALWTQTMKLHIQFEAESSATTLRLWLGFHLGIICWDLMHVLCLGILHHNLGSALWELLLEDVWPVAGHAGGPWQLLRQKQLQLANADFIDWAKQNQVQHSEKKNGNLGNLV